MGCLQVKRQQLSGHYQLPVVAGIHVCMMMSTGKKERWCGDMGGGMTRSVERGRDEREMRETKARRERQGNFSPLSAAHLCHLRESG